MARIAQVANFVGPHSGGIRTVLGRLAEGYADAGHEVVQIVPGPQLRRTGQPWGERVELPGVVVPGTGYRLIGPGAVTRVLTGSRPDRLEVHDRSTLRRLGPWARNNGVPSCVVSHERLDRLLAQWTHGYGPTEAVADASNRRLAAHFGRVVCTTDWAAAEFGRIGAGNVVRVPLGVDLDTFSPRVRRVRTQYASEGQILLVHCGRLSAEKRPQRSLTTLATLRAAGLPVRLVVAGDGPLRSRLVRRS